MSSPGADDVCPICLCSIEEEFSRPENCQHRFDLDCLTEWAKLRLSCPSCRATFGAIYTYKLLEGKPTLRKVQKMEQPAEAEPFDETNPLDFTVCEICSGGTHEELLLICDQCDRGFHTFCLTPPLDAVPTSEQWFCPRCEESRMMQPSSSRRSEPSARAIRLVQRTALAERVRRALARNRRVVEIVESSTEEEESDEEEEEEEGEEQEDVSASSSEEEVKDFFEDDARVLGDMEYDVPYGEVPLPSVRRRSKKERTAGKKAAKPKKKKVTKRRTKGKRRKVKRVRRKRTTSTHSTKEGPLDAFVLRRGVARDPIARLSLLGAGLEPVADEDPLITENSRRFDRPITRRKEESPPATNGETEEKANVDTCDLLGSIIPEQTKTLAPGRLFAVRGGRFNTTEDFEKYKARTTDHMSSELKERLGIPVEKADPPEERPKHNKDSEVHKADTTGVNKQESSSIQGGDYTLFKKPELKDAIRYREYKKKEAKSALCSRIPDRNMKQSSDERRSSGYRHCSDDRKRNDQDRKPEERCQQSVRREGYPHGQNSGERTSAVKDRDHSSNAQYERYAEGSSHSKFGAAKVHASDEKKASATLNQERQRNDFLRLMRDGKAESSSAQKSNQYEKLGSSRNSSNAASSLQRHQSDHDRKVPSEKKVEEHRTLSNQKLTQLAKQTVEMTSSLSLRNVRPNNSSCEYQHHNVNGKCTGSFEAKRDDNSKRPHLVERKYHSNHLNPSSDSLRSANSDRQLKPEKSEREDRGLDTKPVSEKISTEDPSACVSSTEWMPNLQAPSAAPATGPSPNGAKSEASNRKMSSEELLSTIEGFAKDGIRFYKRRLTREEYKDVMRAVVRECYKKRVLDEIKIKEKVKMYVHAVKNGESLPSGHSSMKRNEGPSGIQMSAPIKRPKVETW
uniref:PHD and RING finger domain-containing protein 1 n=1 Tax=Haemonchus contortus TaxID=6289 RepID=A0A7I4YQ36_HAECO